jgi:predicted phosphodiesterase
MKLKRNLISKGLKFLPIPLLMVTVFLPLNVCAQSWKWIAFGDTRNNKPEHREVLESIVENTPDYKFIINVGDVVDHGDIESEWIDWYNTTTNALGDLEQDQIPPKYISTPGNHDATETPEGLENWNKYLSGQVQQYGNEGKFFTFDYENARFIILDSDKSSKTGTQLTMMMDAIQNNPKKWLFVITHRPIFDFGPYSYNDDIHDTWGDPLYQYGCDIIFVGHDHFYLRTKKMELNGNINPPLDPEKGTTQVITANGGASLKDIDPEKDGNGYIVETYIKDHGYTELTMTPDTLHLRHILKNGTVFDEAIFMPNLKESISSFDDMNGMQLIPPTFQLYQNYPNPFNSNTTISYILSQTEQASLKVYNIKSEIVTILEDEIMNVGLHQNNWNSLDLNGNVLSSGIYFCRLQSGYKVKTVKMILTR